jgi:hypothetical protein
MKTVKQIADEIGVSKQSVYKRVRGSLHTDIAPYVHTINGVLYVDDAGESLVISAYNKDIPHTKTTYESAHEPHTRSTQVDVVQTLIKQLSIKDEQIEKQQQSIHELTVALENMTAGLLAAQQTAQAAQMLHAGTMQKQIMDGEPPAEMEVVKKRRFFDFFRK